MSCTGIKANECVTVLFDTGADTCFISASFTASAGLKITPTAMRGATCADERTARILGRVAVCLALKEHTSRFDCAVVRMTQSLDAILGRDWLTQQRSLTDCLCSRITLRGNTRKATIVLQSFRKRALAEPVKAPTPGVSAMLCFVNLGDSPVTAPETPRDVSEVLGEFRDIVRDADTLPGRPPDPRIRLQLSRLSPVPSL